MTPTMFYPSRSLAAKAAKKAGHERSFRCIRSPSHGWKWTAFAGYDDAAHEYAKGKDWIAHVEIGHIDEGRQPGYRGILVVTCLPEEIPEEARRMHWDIEPISLELFGAFTEAQEGKPRSTGGAPRAKSDVASPTKLVWQIADSMPEASREEVIAACVAAGVNKATASTQFYKWRSANKG